MSEDGSAAPLVPARGLRKEYGSGEGLVRAVDEIDLEVARGEALAIMGPSGCGKSTLLHLIGAGGGGSPEHRPGAGGRGSRGPGDVAPHLQPSTNRS